MPGQARGRSGTAVAFVASLAAHSAALAFLLLSVGARTMAPPEKPIEIDLVQQEARVVGAPKPPPPPQPAPPSESQPTPAANVPSPEAPRAPDAPAASSRTAAQTAPAAKPAPKPDPSVNLGNGSDDQDPLSVYGDNVVAPKPDARYHNLPPRYPASASRIGAEGIVRIVAHVLPTGLPASVGIVSSSGNSDLDAEARRAVLLWHFTPAIAAGRAVPFDYVMNIRFALGER